ncbi:MAG: DUF2490 domain-containing protein [Bacteroidota bacterium]
MNLRNTLSRPGGYILLPIIFVLLFRTANAQTQFAGWLGTFQNYKLTDKTGIYFDGQLRTTGQWQQVHSLLLRPGLNIYFNPALTGTVGYAYIHQQRMASGVTGYIPEHRIWEQLMYTHRINRPHAAHAASLTHRLRLEQRWLPKVHAEEGHLVRNGHAHAGRLRYFARGVLPLTGSRHSDNGTLADPQGHGSSASAGSGSAAPFTQGFFAAIQNEIFTNISGSSVVNGKFFDQNRAYFAVGYRCSRQFDVELGYMNQYISGTGSNSTNNHILQMATYLRL